MVWSLVARIVASTLLIICTFPLSRLHAQSPSQDTVKLYFGGDVNFGLFFADKIHDDLSYPFDRMKWLGEADVAMVNLENAMTRRGKRQHKEFVFHTKPKYGQLLREARIGLVTLANNHIYDYGREGIFDTMELLDSLGIKHVGAGANIDSARSPVIVERKGLRVGFLGYMDSISTTNLYFAKARKAGPAVLNRGYLVEDIGKLKAKCDFVVINIHWGVEKSRTPLQRQIELAHAAIDAGADLIIGHHPHVLQGIEVYRGKVIAYSLGNFLFGGSSRESYPTALLKVTIPVRAIDSARCEIVPIYVDHWQPRAFEGTGGTGVIDTIRHYSREFEKSIF